MPIDADTPACEDYVDAVQRRREQQEREAFDATIYPIVDAFFQEDNRPTRQSVTAYQVVKRKDGGITFRLVVNEQYTSGIEQYIIDFWKQQLDVPISVSIVDEIPLMHNNKRLTIIEE